MQTFLIFLVAAVIILPFICSPQENFLLKNPYDSLETTYYKQHYYNRTTPIGIKKSPGFFKQYPDYFEQPGLLKHNWLGYSITGYPYQDYKFSSVASTKEVDLKHLNKRFLYPEWYNTHRKESNYIGYPFYFGGKHNY